MKGKTLIKLFKDEKELPPLLAIGSIIRPYKGECADNELIVELKSLIKILKQL